MPGTPPATARLAIPRYSDGDTASFSAQVNAISDTTDSKVALLAPRVTTLPSSPVDGDECFLVADSANGVIWRLRYNASSASTYKWEFIGGPPMAAIIGNQDFSTITSYGDLTHVGPSLTLPVAGDFDITTEFVGAIGTGGSGYLFMSYQLGASGPGDSFASSGGASGTTGAPTFSPMRTDRWTGRSAGDVLTAKYRTTGNPNLSFSARSVRVSPVRVG